MIIDGKKIAADIEDKLKAKITSLKRPPSLAVVLVGEDPASSIYVRRKAEACRRVGIRSIEKRFSKSISEEDLLAELELLNSNPNINGILVQLPLPPQIDTATIIDSLDHLKDVDGFHPINLGRLLSGRKDCLISCTPLGIYQLLQHAKIEVSGKHVVILGRSNIVGKPMAAILMQQWEGANATVTVVHSKTRDLSTQCQRADILIAACGRPHMVTKEMIGQGAVVIDVGINRIQDSGSKKGYKIVGDVDFENVKDHCRAITPVPGGVGPLTIAMLMQNTLTAYRLQKDALDR